jgi:hypothetical protein
MHIFISIFYSQRSRILLWQDNQTITAYNNFKTLIIYRDTCSQMHFTNVDTKAAIAE